MYNNIVNKLYKSYSEIVQLREELELLERKFSGENYVKDVEYKGKMYDRYQAAALTKLERFLAYSHTYNPNAPDDRGYFSCLENPEISHIAMSFLSSVIESGVDVNKIEHIEKYDMEQLPALAALLSAGMDIDNVSFATLSGERMIARATGEPWRIDRKDNTNLSDYEHAEILRKRDSEQEEKLLEMRKNANTDGYYAIYQLRRDRTEHEFESYDTVIHSGGSINEMYYNLLYTDRIDSIGSENTHELLDNLFSEFNGDSRPLYFYGHSLSVSDVIVLNQHGRRDAYYCDSFGFVKLNDFLLDKQPTKNQIHIPDGMDEVVVTNGEIFISIHDFSEGGYEYTIYDLYKRELDGGVYDNDAITMQEALNEIIDDIYTEEEFVIIPFADSFIEEAEQVNSAVMNFEAKTRQMYNEDTLGLTYEELKQEVSDYISQQIEDIPIAAYGVIIAGSRSRGLENDNSDIDVVFEYNGDMKEYEVFNILHEEPFTIAGKVVDVNPIRPQESGTLQDYLLGADAYLDEQLQLRAKQVVSNKRVMKLTGEPVSEEMLSILERCKNGELVDISEIEATKEIKTARSCVLHEIPTIERKDREAVTEHVFDEMMKFGSAVVDEDGNTVYNGIVEQGYRLDIVLGLPASGKSSTIVNDISKTYHSRLVDCDEAKKLLPEYNNGWGANTVHKESQMIEKAAFFASLQNQDNIVLAKVGGNVQKLVEDYIIPAKKFGYKVNIHYVELNRNVALGRMLERFLDDGRFLDPNLIDKYDNPVIGNSIRATYEQLKESSMIDGYSKWDNNVAKGCEPVKLEKKDNIQGMDTGTINSKQNKGGRKL